MKLYKFIFKEETIPKSGESSGAPAIFKNGTSPEKIVFLTEKEIIQIISYIPYYKDVLADILAGDESWIVAKKVKEYAIFFKKQPINYKKITTYYCNRR